MCGKCDVTVVEVYTVLLYCNFVDNYEGSVSYHQSSIWIKKKTPLRLSIFWCFISIPAVSGVI